MRAYKNIQRLVALSCLLVPVVIAMGAFTRLVDAGLGCPDWPSCYGHLFLWPQSDQDIMLANSLFADHPVDVAKTWPEVIHRYIAGILGLLMLTITFGLYKIRNSCSVPWKHSMALLVLLLFQIAFGAYTVTLKLWPQVVSIHLLTGVAIFAGLATLWVRLCKPKWHVTSDHKNTLKGISKWLTFSIIVLVVQIFLGSWVSSNYAAVACGDFPTCQGEWWVNLSFEAFNFFQTTGPNYSGGLLDNNLRMAIHFAHRIGALAVLVVLSITCYKLISMRQRNFSYLALLIMLLLAIQIALGISGVMLGVPIIIAVLHNITAAFLLVSLAITKTQQLSHCE